MNLCSHLLMIFEYEISKGNKILETSEGWTNANFVMDLQNPMDIEYEKLNLIDTIYVKYWESYDTHYPPQKGFYCEKCKHSIAGPMDKDDLEKHNILRFWK